MYFPLFSLQENFCIGDTIELFFVERSFRMKQIRKGRKWSIGRFVFERESRISLNIIREIYKNDIPI